MKLNLGCGQDVRNGYVNIDRLPSNCSDPSVYRQGDITSLDWMAEDGSVEEILALDCVEYVDHNFINDTIVNWVNKLKVGGVIRMLFPDCYSVAKAFMQGQLDLKQYTQITFGFDSKIDNRKSMIDVLTVISLLEKSGLNIVVKRYEGIAFYLEAEKC